MSLHSPVIAPIISAIGGGLPWDAQSAGGPPLEAVIASILGTGAGGGAQRLFHALHPSKFDSLGAVGSWSPSIGSGAATQGTGTMQPAYSAAGINGRPAILFDAGDLLATANADRSGFEFLAVAAVVECANGAVVFVPVEFGSLNAGDLGGVRLLGHEVVNNFAGSGRAASGIATTRAAGAFTSAPCVLMVTVDYSLTTHCVEVYLNGVLASTTYPGDPDLSASVGANKPLYIGNRAAGDLGISGKIGAVLEYALPTSPTAPQLAALLEANRVMGRAWGIS